MRFRVELELFAGPLDLLWYLVRKQELDIMDIPIARVTEQYLELIEVIEQIDVNAVGDFLELATRLMEIKSRMILPRHEEDEKEESEVEDPRQDIVQRLLEYKKYKDAASMLAERGQLWQRRFARRVNDLPTGGADPSEQPIHEIEMWDLVSAFARVVRDNATARPSAIRYDDTPIEVYMDRIRERLATESSLSFKSLFQADMHRSQLIGIFLAVLELIRHHNIRAEQQELFGEIWISAMAGEDKDAQVAA
ncbi:segregation and condensation protein A [Bythopirellula polymerisocia]|uniref:Segregation and condensation protein A n=1 Tax=Bythopirellula polymerisocia TaxID=2528003 RepID=A0A5C6CZU3_9BACT|nr:segregation/condensation protein A [Bythopirellula polymerisocia]TWU28189.1 Segregation and condensation protein A [Bythopirellula polymerisocia]